MIELIIVIVVWLILGFVGVFLLTRDMKDYKFTNGDVVFFGFLLFLGAFTFVAGIMDFFIEYLPYWIGEKGIKKRNWKITDWLNKKSKEIRNDEK